MSHKDFCITPSKSGEIETVYSEAIYSGTMELKDSFHLAQSKPGITISETVFSEAKISHSCLKECFSCVPPGHSNTTDFVHSALSEPGHSMPVIPESTNSMTAISGYVEFEIINLETVFSEATFSASVDYKDFFHALFEPRTITTKKLKANSETEDSETVHVAAKVAFLETDSLSRASPEAGL